MKQLWWGTHVKSLTSQTRNQLCNNSASRTPYYFRQTVVRKSQVEDVEPKGIFRCLDSTSYYYVFFLFYFPSSIPLRSFTFVDLLHGWIFHSFNRLDFPLTVLLHCMAIRQSARPTRPQTARPPSSRPIIWNCPLPNWQSEIIMSQWTLPLSCEFSNRSSTKSKFESNSNSRENSN